MTNLKKWTMAAASAALVTASGNAQVIGSACGCTTPVGSRPQVLMSSLVDVNKNLINASTTLTCDKLYILDTRVYVIDGQDLYVQPGSVIKANTSPGSSYSIIVSKGGQIWANGSESCPIIMTTAADNLDGNYSVTNRGLWGGLVVMGKAYNNTWHTDGSVNNTATDGVAVIEGLSAADPRDLYGMPAGQEVNNDNSGIIRYVSLRHGGEVIGANNEINGLSLGSVGSGTTIDHVEVIGNKDDGFEFFGGTVNAKNLVYMHCDDDGFDWDEAYKGKLQFIYGVQGPDNSGGANNQGDNGIEADSDDAASNFANSGQRSTPVVYNCTIIARNLNDEGIEAKERTQGTIVNSIFARFAEGLNMTTDCETFWNAGTFQVKNCTFQECTNPLRINGVNQTSGTNFNKFTVTDGNLIVGANALIDATYAMTQPNNVLTDRVNPVPAAGTATTSLTPPVDEFFTGAKYRGAFEPGALPWTQKWTLASQIGLDVASTAGCTGDLDHNGTVNTDDFGLFVNAYNSNCY